MQITTDIVTVSLAGTENLCHRLGGRCGPGGIGTAQNRLQCGLPAYLVSEAR
ncbi:hypothetical protein GCM10027605_74320 [Micromonospora zhanjiangensis]